jgi:hypothetical protein
MSERMQGVGAETNPVHLVNPTLAFLRDYWNQKRGARPMPARGDIRPSEFRRHLGWVVMADVLRGGQEFRYRLVGTLVTQYFLSEGTGKTLTEAFHGWDRSVLNGVRAVMRTVVREKTIIRAFGAPDAFATGFEAFDAIFLPLSDDGEHVNVILHAFVFDQPDVLMARQIARAHGGQLIPRVKAGRGTA